jgi:methionyl-tRNA formyltransferase
MRLAFLGTASFAIPTLKKLIDSDHNVVAVVTGPDKPRGRGQALAPTPVKQAALDAGVPETAILTPQSPSDEGFIARYTGLDLDAAVVVAYRILLPEVFNYPEHGTLNVHPSKLPKYRGPAPLNWALINGDKETAVSVIRISERVDAGGVVLQTPVPILPDDNVDTLARRLAPLGGEMVLDALNKLKSGELSPLEQDESQVTKAPKLSKEDGRIDWQKPAHAIHNLIRGVTPWPGAFTTLPDGKLLKIFKSEDVAAGSEKSPGTVLPSSDDSRDGIEVACGEGILRVTDIQLQGKKRMPVSDFLRGYRLSTGDRLGEL